MSDNIRRAFLACTRGDFAVLESLVPSKVNINEAIFQFYFFFLYGLFHQLLVAMLKCFILLLVVERQIVFRI